MAVPIGIQIAQVGAGILGGIGDALTGSARNRAEERHQAAMLALQQASLAQQNRQFGITSAENSREFDATHALDSQKFAGQQENTQFGRQQNARFAAVRAPLISGLGSGQLLKNNPNWQKYAAVGG